MSRRGTRTAVHCTSTAACALLVLVGISSCGSSSHGVEVATVGHGTVTEIVQAPATVTARARATVTAAADGRVLRLLVHDGEHVHRGQLLAVIDSPSARHRLAQARKADRQAAVTAVASPGLDVGTTQSAADSAAHRAFSAARRAVHAIPVAALRARARTALAQAEADYAEVRAQAALAIDRLDAGVSGLSNAMSALVAAQRVQTGAAVDIAKATVRALVVRAPLPGVVSLGGSSSGGQSLSGLVSQLPPALQSQVSSLSGGAATSTGSSSGGSTSSQRIAAGVPVSAGSAIATVTDDSVESLVAQVDETDILLVHRGVGATVQLDAVRSGSYTGTVTAIDPVAHQSSQGGTTYDVHLSLRRGSLSGGGVAPRPLPGMTAVASLQVRHAVGAVSIPESAILRNGRSNTVWVSDEGRARRAVVRLGAEGDVHAQVLGGVRIGQRIVVKGADKVHEGERIPE